MVQIARLCRPVCRRLLHTPTRLAGIRHDPGESEERLFALAQRPLKSRQAPILKIQTDPASLRDAEAQKAFAIDLPSMKDPLPLVDTLYKTFQSSGIVCSPKLAVSILDAAIRVGSLAAARRYLALFPSQYVLRKADATRLLASVVAQLDLPASAGHRFGAWRRADTLSFLTGSGRCLQTMLDVPGVQTEYNAALHRLGALELEPKVESLSVDKDSVEHALQHLESLFQKPATS